jgi:hypothetical protein
MRPLLIPGLLLLTLSLPVQADDVSRKAYRRKEQRLLDKEVKHTNTKCGASMRMLIDWRSWEDRASPDPSPHAACAAILRVVERICETSDGQDSMRQMLKTVRCQYTNEARVVATDNPGEEWIFLYSREWEDSPEYAEKLESWLRKLAP